MAAAPSITRHASRRDSQPAIDEIGEEDADGDGELVGGNEAAAQAGQRHFSGIERRGDSCHADPDTDNEPPRDQDDRVGCRCLHKGAQREHRAGDQDRTFAADPVRQFAAGERAEQGAQGDPAGHHFDEQCGE
jgi:hypothetical protein